MEKGEVFEGGVEKMNGSASVFQFSLWNSLLFLFLKKNNSFMGLC